MRVLTIGDTSWTDRGDGVYLPRQEYVVDELWGSNGCNGLVMLEKVMPNEQYIPIAVCYSVDLNSVSILKSMVSDLKNDGVNAIIHIGCDLSTDFIGGIMLK